MVCNEILDRLSLVIRLNNIIYIILSQRTRGLVTGMDNIQDMPIRLESNPFPFPDGVLPLPSFFKIGTVHVPCSASTLWVEYVPNRSLSK